MIPFNKPLTIPVSSPVNSQNQTDKKLSPSDWEITSSLDEDLLDQDYARTQANSDSINYLLEPSENLKKQVFEYLRNNNIPQIANPTLTEHQTFSYGDNHFVLNEEIHILHVDAIMLNLVNTDMVSKTMKKNPRQLARLMDLSGFAEISFEHDLLRALDVAYIVQITANAMSIYLTHSFAEKNEKKKIKKNEKNKRNEKKNDDEILRTTLSSRMGETLLDTFMHHFFIYDFFKPSESAPETYAEYPRRSFLNLLELADCITNLTNEMEYNLIKEEHHLTLDFSLVFHYKKIIAAFLRHHVLTYDNLTESDQACQDNLEQSYNNHSTNERECFISTFLVDFTKTGFNMANEVIEAFINKGIFQEFVQPSNVAILKLNHTYEFHFMAAATYNKPRIYHKRNATVHIEDSRNNIRINIGLRNKYYDNHNDVTVKASKRLKQLFDFYNDTPFVINKSSYKNIIEIMKLISNEPELYSPIMVAFFKMFYHIDLIKLKTNNNDPKLIERLIKFGLLFSTHNDKTLSREVKQNIAANKMYNVLCSYKYFIKGLLNDSNLFSCFKRFFMDHHGTSTGRIGTSSYFLQLQGHKLAKTIILFEKQAFLNEHQLLRKNEIISSEIPEIQHYRWFNDYSVFIKETRGLYNGFIKSFCNPETKLESYPWQSTDLKEQLLWLEHHCKKPQSILLLRELLHAVMENSGTSLEFLANCGNYIYTKDATASGIQIISMALRDKTLGHLVNVGDDLVRPADIYGEALKFFMEHLDYKHFIFDPFTQDLFGMSSKDFIRESILLYDNPSATGSLTIKENYSFTEALKVFLNKTPNTNNARDISNFIERYATAPDLNKIQRHGLPAEDLFELEASTSGLESKPLNKSLSRLQHYVLNLRKISKLPKSILTRSLMKPLVMCYGYGQGSDGRKDDLEVYFKDHFISEGHNIIPLLESDVKCFSKIIEQGFSKFLKGDMNAMEHFKRICNKFVNSKLETGAAVEITTPYLTWKYVGTSQKSTRHRVILPNGKTRNYQIFLNSLKLYDDMGAAFAPIFVQGLDAFIVQTCLDLCEKINKKLIAENLPPILMHFNHDDFGVNASNAVYLMSIVRFAYHQLNTLTFPELPSLFNPKKPALRVDNNHFIKH